MTRTERMTGTWRRGRSLLAVALVTIATVAISPHPAEAATGDGYSYAERVALAGAVWTTEADGVSSTLEIRVHHLDNRSTWEGPANYTQPGIILFYTERVTDPATGAITETNYEGFAGSGDNEFRFDHSLAGATARFDLTLWGYRCVYQSGDSGGGPQGISAEAACEDLPDTGIVGEIEWSGVGPITRDTANDMFSEPPHAMFHNHVVTAVRDATATGTIAGEGLVLADGAASHAVLLRGKYAEHYVSAGRPTAP